MKASIVSKLDVLVDRHEELGMLLSDPGVIADQDKYRLFSTEYSELEQLVSQYKELLSKEDELAEILVLLEDIDPEIKLLASSEKTRIDQDISLLEKTIETLLLPRDPNDTKNVFLEIRAGTGGDEAAIFSGDLFQKGLVLNNIPFLSYITFLMLIYVAYGYHVDSTVLSISKANKKGEKLYSELQSALELYDKESLQSKVVEETSKWGLYESIDPPIIINSKQVNEE